MGIYPSSNCYSHAIMENSMFSNTSTLFVDPRSLLSPTPIKIS